MKGWKVVTRRYSGELKGDNIVWKHKDTAAHKLASEQRSLGDFEEVKMDEVRYDIVGSDEKKRGLVLVGRIVHYLRTDLLEDLILAEAKAKLTPAELKVLESHFKS